METHLLERSPTRSTDLHASLRACIINRNTLVIVLYCYSLLRLLSTRAADGVYYAVGNSILREWRFSKSSDTGMVYNRIYRFLARLSTDIEI